MHRPNQVCCKHQYNGGDKKQKKEETEKETLLKLPRCVKHTIVEKIDVCIEAERVVYAEKNMSFKAFCRF